MKYFAVLGILCFMLSTLIGCQNADSGFKDVETGVDVVIEGGGKFPEEFAGRWKVEGKSGWEITFTPDGSISSAVIPLGRVKLEPGKTTTIPMVMDRKSVFYPGQWIVNYDPQDSSLMVTITLEYFRAELGEAILEGKSVDVLDGLITVSDDSKSWQVVWMSFPDYTAHTAKYPDFRMTEGDSPATTKTLKFVKVE